MKNLKEVALLVFFILLGTMVLDHGVRSSQVQPKCCSTQVNK